MSIDVQTVIRNTCLYRGGEFAVLMAMADCANTGDGCGIYPGIDLLAANARMSVRQCQENIKRLRDDGVVILVGPDGEDLGRKETPAGGRGRKTEWRIDLERVRELQGLHERENGPCDFCKTRAERVNKRVRFDAKKGAVSAAKGEVCDTKGEVSRAPYIDEPKEPYEPARTNARAREANAGEVQERAEPEAPDTPQAAPPGHRRAQPYSSGFQDRVWIEFRKWPPNSGSKFDAWKVCEQLKREGVLPSDGDLVVAIRAEGRWMAEQSARRRPNDPFPPPHPATWLRRRGWERWLCDTPPEEFTPRRITLKPEHVAALKRAGIDDALIAAWFADGEFDPGPPPVFYASNAMRRDLIASRYGPRLEAAFPGLRLLVKEARAA